MKFSIRTLVRASLFAALVFVVTKAVQFPTGGSGYIHIGDSIIYIATLFLPFPVAGLAGAVGAGMSDLLSGATVYIIPTMIIKFLLVGVWGWIAKEGKDRLVPNIIISVSGIFITCVGYGITSWLLYGDIKAAFAGMATNSLQAIASGIIFIIVTLYIRSTKNGKNLLSE